MAELSALLKDSPLGWFWLPDQVDQQVAGVIIERNDKLRLELIEPFAERPLSTSTDERNFYPVICGWLSRGGAITLFSCSAGTSVNIPGNEWEFCSFAFAIQGQPLENAEDFLFNKATVHLTGLVDWTALNGLKEGWQENIAVHGGRTWTASYVLPEPRVFQADDGLMIKLHATCHSSTVGRFGTQFLQDAVLEVALQKGVAFLEMESKVHGIRQLLMLLSGLELRPTWNQVVRVSNEDALSVFYNCAPRPDLEPAPPVLRTFVPFEDVSGELVGLLNRWVDVQKKYGDAVATGLFTLYLPHTYETKVSNLVNCLVWYAEADAGGELALKQGVRPLKGGVAAYVVEKTVRRYRPTVSSDFIRDLKEKIANTRHYYTHFNPAKKEFAAEGAELANLVDFLDVLNRCVLLEKLGLETDRILQWVHKSHEYGERFRMRRFQGFGS